MNGEPNYIYLFKTSHFREPREFPTSWSWDYPEYLAEDAAEYFHDNCDGWENSWPIQFEIYRMLPERGAEPELIATLSVEREARPAFSATTISKTLAD